MIPVAHPHQAHSKRFLSFDSSLAPRTPVQPYGMHLENSYFWWHTDSVKDHQFLQWSRWNPVLLTETSDFSYSHLLSPWIEGNSLKGWFLPFLDSFPGKPPRQRKDLCSLTVRLLLTPLEKVVVPVYHYSWTCCYLHCLVFSAYQRFLFLLSYILTWLMCLQCRTRSNDRPVITLILK